MYDTVAVALKFGSHFTGGIGVLSAARIGGQKGVGRERGPFTLHKQLT